MKKKIIGLMLGMVLALGLTACGGGDDANSADVQSGEIQQEAQQEPQTSVEESKEQEATQSQQAESQPVQDLAQETSQESVPAAAQESSETAKQESATIVETPKEDVWVPDEFVYNDVKSLDFVAPAAHTGGGEQCTFFWDCTEKDLTDWFVERYGDREGNFVENVSNFTHTNSYDRRSYTIYKSNYSTCEYYDMSMSSGMYNENVVHSASLVIENQSQDVVIEEAKAFFELVGLKDYAEDIIFSEELSLKIPTENGKGAYSASASYGVNEYSKKYSIRVSVSYLDAAFYNEIEAYDAANVEYWEDYYTLAEYLPNCEFDTSSVAALTVEEKAYIEELYSNTYDREVSVEENFKYTRENFEKITDAEFEYWARCKDAEYETGCLSLKYIQEDDEIEFEISPSGRQQFENMGEYHNISDGRDLTEAEIQQLCEARYQLLKKVDSKIDASVEDLVKLFRYYELDEELDKINFESEDYKYRMYNTLSGLTLYGEPKAE